MVYPVHQVEVAHFIIIGRPDVGGAIPGALHGAA